MLGAGVNEGFQVGFAQFQRDENTPTLIKSALFPYGEEPIYPAVWPCELTDW